MIQPVLEKYGDRVKSHSVEVKITDATGKYFLPDDAILRSKVIVGVFCVKNPDDNAYSPDSDRPIISDNGLNSAYLTLVCDSKEVISNHPLMHLAVNEYDRSVKEIMVPMLTPSKSFVTIANPGTPANKADVGESILLHFIYLD
jgi:hypothetical protein